MIMIRQGYASDRQGVRTAPNAQPRRPESRGVISALQQGPHRTIRHGPRRWREVLRYSQDDWRVPRATRKVDALECSLTTQASLARSYALMSAQGCARSNEKTRWRAP